MASTSSNRFTTKRKEKRLNNQNGGENRKERQITIQMGACRRLRSEVASYQKEVEQQAKHIESMKEKPDVYDEYDINKQRQVLEESSSMIKVVQTQLERATQALQDALDKAPTTLDTKDALLLLKELKE
mmetsp:Transcript_12716/g.19238  ORF Transcript_12716/g.19238 Transcript_12716/m.19238 type:complete len:129 (+) Transcript_12716:351-737(+)